VLRFLTNIPRDERTALSLRGSKRLELSVNARLRPVGNDQLMTTAASDGPTRRRQSLPSLHPLGTIVGAECARDGQPNGL
jgi:hypothetical protein